MAGLPRAPSRRMYSWWWDSHISPKNSRWLQENLADMDTKVKAMIKLIEEDADSFARRAEMYYKKRPELMQLVEEFYRAYRALAERYDNATGALRQAQRTMAEAFPNQVMPGASDDSPESTVSEVDPYTPDLLPPKRALIGTVAEGRVRKGLNFHDLDGKGRSTEIKDNHIIHNEGLSEKTEAMRNFEKEIQALKEDLAKLEAEREDGLVKYEQSLEMMHTLESEVSCAKEDSRGLNDRANKAEGEVQTLRESLAKIEAEKEKCLLEYQNCLDKLATLENDISHAKENIEELNERACRAESEKDDALDRYKQSIEMISTIESKLKLAEDYAKELSERADKAEREVETLKKALVKLTEENEVAALQYRQCLETISILEQKLSCAEEEVHRLKGELDSEVSKLKGAEERCLMLEKSKQTLNSEFESLVLKMGSQSEELMEKQKELGKLWTCLQEERLRFVEAETAFQTLQHLHSQTQEQLRSLALELEKRDQLLKATEIHNETLLDEVTKIKEENQTLNELNMFSSMSIKKMQNEILGLMESKQKLTEEVEVRVDQRNALQQEIYCLKEDLNELNKKHQVMSQQVDAVGLRPEDFESSVKQLQTENTDLKETFEKEKSEKILLTKKLVIMEQLLEKNALLEKSLSNLTAELEGARGKINALEESFEALLEEKSTILAEKAILMSRLQVMIENLERASEKNNCLENSLSDACDEIEGLKETSKSLEDSCRLLENEKFNLINEKDALVLEGKTTQQTLEALEKRQRELEDRYSSLEKERDSTNCKLEELRLSLDLEKQEHANFAQKTETQLAGMGKQIHFLQEEVFFRRREFEEELDKAMNYQLEIFILRSCVEDLKEKNSSLLIECQKLIEASKLSERLVSELRRDNLDKQMEVESLSDQTSMLKMGMSELLKALGIDHGFEDKLGEDLGCLSRMLHKLEDSRGSFHQVRDKNQQLEIEIVVLMTLIEQLSLDAKTLKKERNVTEQELEIKNEQLSLSQNKVNKLLELNEEQNMEVSKLSAVENENSELQTEVAGLKKKIDETNVARSDQENQICRLSDDNSHLSEKNHCLEKANMELGSKLERLHGQHENTVQLWESEATTNFEEIQVSTVVRALLEEKFHQIRGEIASKGVQIELLKERISSLEGENGGLKSELASYVPLIVLLKDSVSYLESLTLHVGLQKIHNQGVKEIGTISHHDVESCNDPNADPKVPSVYFELQDLQYRLKAIEKAAIQKERLVAQENYDSNTKVEAAVEKVNALKFRGVSDRAYSVPVSDISEFENEILMKDIMLDQNSESSSHEISRRGHTQSQSKMVESWDAADLDRGINLTVVKGKKVKSPTSEGNYYRGDILKRQKSRHRSSEKVAEKELGVDKLQISRTFSQRGQEVTKTKILERLNSDVHKLTNLQITVQDLMKQIEIIEKGKMGKAMYERDTLREQLEEAEEAILELFDFNSKLTRNVEKRSFSSDIKTGVDGEDSGSARRRRISEQARKMSEKIGRLQLEVQKIQFVLLKLNDESEKESKGKSRIMDIKRRVLLRDYLYGVRNPSLHRRKKATFCGCVQPPTRGD